MYFYVVLTNLELTVILLPSGGIRTVSRSDQLCCLFIAVSAVAQTINSLYNEEDLEILVVPRLPPGC